MTRALILLRTHFVDARVLALARAYAAGGDYDVRIALDETAGEIDSGGFPKLSMTLNSCVRLGLDVAHDKPMWRCGDYLFYHALQLETPYPRIWSIEYDIAINLADPLDFFRRLDAEAGEDYLTTFLQIAEPSWIWRKAAAKRFPVVYSSGFAVVRLKREAAAKLWALRRHEAARPRGGEVFSDDVWINDESFVSSAIPDLGLKMADINAYGEVYSKATLKREGVIHPADLPAFDGKIHHAVRTGSAFLSAAASYYDFDVAAFLNRAEADLPGFLPAATQVIFRALAKIPDDPATLLAALGTALAPFEDPRRAEALLRALARRRMRVCLEAIQFGRVAPNIGRGPAFDNIALGRPAWQSSVSPRARHRDLRLDAEGGVDGDRDVEFGFHTAQEDGPWWAVDLGGVHALAGVRLFNRRMHPGRLRGFEIEGSADFLHWESWFVHDEGAPEILRDDPIVLALHPPREARYLRVKLRRKGVLHLVEVEAIRA